MATHHDPHSDRRAYLAWLMRVLLFAVVAVVGSAGPAYFYHARLQAIGEAIGPEQIADISRGEPALWASGFYDTAVHKPAVADRLQPRVAVLGSSRVMQWRREMFAERSRDGFYNLGGGVRNTTELVRCVDQLLAQPAPPELVVIGVDWWWLQHHRPTATPLTQREVLSRRWRRGRTRVLDRAQLYQQAWRAPRVWDAWADPDQTTPTGRTPWGINARTTGGFRNDGSYSYWQFIAHPEGPRHTETEKRRAGLDRIERGDFAGQYVHPIHLKYLDESVGRLRAAGVEVALVLTPIEPGVLDSWRATPGGRAYLPKLHDALRTLTERHDACFADFTNPRELGYGIAGFIDWFHGGEPLYAAMLLDIARQPGYTARLAPFIDAQQLADDLRRPLGPYTLYPG